MAIATIGTPVDLQLGKDIKEIVKQKLGMDDRHIVQSAFIRVSRYNVVTMRPTVIPVAEEE